MDESYLELFQLNTVIIPSDIKTIGNGAYGCVMEVSLVCAAKKIHETLIKFSNVHECEIIKKKFLSECLTCSKLFHPNIVQFLGIYYPKDASFPWLLMEKLDTSLTEFLKTTKSDKIMLSSKFSILHDIAQGLHYLHSINIIHRDLSSNNILLTKMLVAKISDLGVAKIIDPSAMNTNTQAPGTTIFMPPEALSLKPRYGKPVDIFSFGCVSLHLMTHEFPIPLSETYIDDETGNKIALYETERREPYLKKVHHPPMLKKLILDCLSDLPKKRPSAMSLIEDIQTIEPELEKKQLMFEVLTPICMLLSILSLTVSVCNKTAKYLNFVRVKAVTDSLVGQVWPDHYFSR